MTHKKCKALTSKGLQCKRDATKGDFCAQHTSKKSKPSPKKATPKKDTKNSVKTHNTIYSIIIWKSESNYEKGKYIQFLGSSKRLLQKELGKYIKSIEKSLGLSKKDIKSFPKTLTSLPYDEVETYELLRGLYAVKLQKQKLRVK